MYSTKNVEFSVDIRDVQIKLSLAIYISNTGNHFGYNRSHNFLKRPF